MGRDTLPAAGAPDCDRVRRHTPCFDKLSMRSVWSRGAFPDSFNLSLSKDGA